MLDEMKTHMFGQSMKPIADEIAFFERCHGDKCVIDIYEQVVDIDKHPTTELYRDNPMYNFLGDVLGSEKVKFDIQIHNPSDAEYVVVKRVLINGKGNSADVFGTVYPYDKVDKSVDVKAYYPSNPNWMRLEERMDNKIAAEILLTATRNTKQHIYSQLEEELNAVNSIHDVVDQEALYGHLL